MRDYTILKHCAEQAEYTMGDFGFRPISLPNTGDRVAPHEHPEFSHVTIVTAGRALIRAWCDEGCHREQDCGPGDKFLVPKGWQHEMIALEPNTKAECMFSLLVAPGDPQRAMR
jgi:quercetin dioxygenase-like cupin family protein